MPEVTPRQLGAAVVAAVAVALLAAVYLSRGDGAPAATPPAAAIEVEGGESGGDGGGSVVVHVAGAVRDPGVYRLREGARVDDAVGRAGGATQRADLSQVNLAAKVEDGRQILVPRRVPAGAPPTPGGTAPTAGGAPPVPLNLNTATLEQLDQLPGIGPTTAQKILDFRETNGGFGSVEELGEISGIGEKRLATLREQVRV